VPLAVALGTAVPLAAATELPRVHLLATGGTISGGPQPLDAAGLAALVPGVKQIATVTMEDVTRVGSSRMTPELQFKLASRINELFAKDRSDHAHRRQRRSPDSCRDCRGREGDRRRSLRPR